MQVKHILKLIRIDQWYKNLLIFLPLSFTKQAQSPHFLIIGFFGFCCLSSITYIINDWIDKEKDRLHPIKKERPLASGKITGKQAILIILLISLPSILAAFYLGKIYSSMLALYFIATNSYSFGLKNIPILDIFLISSNFILRTVAGMNSLPQNDSTPYLGVLLSIITIFLSHKRRSDNKILGKKAKSHKPVLVFYNQKNTYILRTIAFISLAIFSYILFIQTKQIQTIVAILFITITTSLIFSKNPSTVIKPQQLFKNWIWLSALVLTILLILF